jgi:hypothetical protein
MIISHHAPGGAEIDVAIVFGDGCNIPKIGITNPIPGLVWSSLCRFAEQRKGKQKQHKEQTGSPHR